MKKNKIKLGMMLLLLALSAPAFAAPAAPQCSVPRLRNLVDDLSDQPATKNAKLPDADDIVKNSILQKLVTQKPLTQWLGLGWQGPMNGVLFAVTCDDKTLDAMVVGAVDEIKAGPELPVVGDTVIVSATDASGTGTLHRSISIFALKGGKIASFWHHTLYEDAYVAGSDGDESEFQVTMPNANSIDVTGEHRVYRQIPGANDWDKTPYKIQKLHETYCWDNTQSTYAVCKAAPAKH
ncbi:MAG TPA: hypothetical protein VGM47_02445 [Gammaproteobacteria bacterium]|jgi:hypothetical protein